MHRFFVDKQNILQDQYHILIDDPEDVKHITKVLRLTEGEKIEVCDGDNMDYICSIKGLQKSGIDLTILSAKSAETEPPVDVTLFQGIPKSTKMELIIQKCTEVGIGRIVPVITERTIVQLKDSKAEEKKIERWQKIADEAAKQSKRGIIPKIAPPMTFNEIMGYVDDFDLVVIPYEKEEKVGLKKVLRNEEKPTRIAIIIGPEGGFDENEIIKAKNSGIVSISLGPRILRTETAGFIALSIIMYEIGDLGGN